MIEERVQLPDSVVDIAHWQADQEFSVYPEGSREKRRVLCPDPPASPFLIGDHFYLFKESSHRYPEQFWAEIVAYRIGCACGVPVPPAFAAWHSPSGTCGALIEWFYGFRDRPEQRYVHGGSLMQQIVADYDLKRGKQHNYRAFRAWCRAFQRLGLMDAAWSRLWARVLAFDALIGNTDRHHDNWGMLFEWQTDGNRMSRVELAPAFDNGTALGHEIAPASIGSFDDPERLERYINRGCHHMKWDAHDDDRCQHGELLARVARLDPQCLPEMQAVVGVDPAALERAVITTAQIPLPLPLSNARAGLMLRLLLRRRERLIALLASL